MTPATATAAGLSLGTKEARRSDANGRVDIRLQQKGLWLITVVYMQRAAEIPSVDWESFWASLTFDNSE